MEKQGGDPDAKRKSPHDQYADFSPAPVPVNPEDGSPLPVEAMQMQQAPAAPAVTEENMICCRGPCQHFWHVVTLAPDGGISGLKQHSYSCIRNAGMETELGDDCVFDCNLWDPIDPTDLRTRDLRREHYWNTRKDEADES